MSLKAVPPLLRAYNDPVIFRDDRVFRTLLQKQSKYVPSSQGYHSFGAAGSSQIQPEMRKEVADWMLEVCEHQSLQYQHPTCPPEVFCLAMNYVDRFLSACSNIARSQLQLLGAVCLMVAWKVREHEPLSAQKLVEYSDFTLTLDDIMEWEVLLLSKLEWDMSAVIAFDFVEHIISRLEKAAVSQSQEEEGRLSMNALRTSSETLITMCSGHHDFSNLSPCLIAAACVVSTLKTMLAPAADSSSSSDLSMASVSSSSFTTTSSSNPDLDKIFQVIREITSLNKDQIEKCMADVDAMVKRTCTDRKGSPSNRSHQESLVLSPPAVTSTPRRPQQGATATPKKNLKDVMSPPPPKF